MTKIEEYAHQLLNQLYTTESVKRVSMVLEKLSANINFKKMAFEIVTDDNLTDRQKAAQLNNLLTRVEVEELVVFLNNLFTNKEFWLFDSSSFDHFDEFSKTFQTSVDKASIIHMVTAININDEHLQNISAFFNKILEKHTLINHHVNPEIGAGIQIRVDNLIFDYSLSARIKRFENKWIESLVTTSKLISTN